MTLRPAEREQLPAILRPLSAAGRPTLGITSLCPESAVLMAMRLADA